MNGLPTDLDLTPFLGAEVLQVCIGRHQLQIHLHERIQVAVEGGCILRGASQPAMRIEQYGESASSLCRLIGAEVRSASRTDDGGLLLQLSNDLEFQALNDSKQFESFQIHFGDKVYVA
jgi:hypothetical protein